MSEVWLLWEQQNTLYDGKDLLIDIYSDRDIAQRHCEYLNHVEKKRALDDWRIRNKKRLLDFPTSDLKPFFVYYVQIWKVKKI